MIRFSPGLVQGCLALLALVPKHRLTFAQVCSSFASLSSLPSSKVVEIAQSLNWVQADEQGCVVFTPAGARLIGTVGYEAQLRQALLDYIDADRPPWIQNASFGRSRTIAFAGAEVAQVFIEADLADGCSKEIVAFWDELAARARGKTSARLNDIGRVGERLTLQYEHTRTGRNPRWVAIDNNADGYDILSVVGPEDLELLSIEVKTTTLGQRGSFFLTRNEWDRAIESAAHVFHLWNLIAPQQPVLSVVSREQMSGHVPNDSGDGTWEQVEIPYRSFSNTVVSDAMCFRPI